MAGVFQQVLDRLADPATETTQAGVLTQTQSALTALQGILDQLASQITDVGGLELEVANATLATSLTTLGAIGGKLDDIKGYVDGLEASLGALGDASSASSLIGLSKAIKAAVTATLTVDYSAAVPTAVADAATVASITKYIGITVAESSGTATAKVRVRNNNVSGAILDTITLRANESVSYTYPRGRSVGSGTIYLQVVSGAVEGSVFSV